MIILTYIGFIILLVTMIVGTRIMTSYFDASKKKCEELDDEVSDLKDEVFYLKMEIEKLKSEINVRH